MRKSARHGAIIGFSVFLLCSVSQSGLSKEVVYHLLDPPYNPDYVGTTPNPNDANNYFFLRSNQPPDMYSFDINQQYYPIMRDEYFYRDYGDWEVGDYENTDRGATAYDTYNYGSW